MKRFRQRAAPIGALFGAVQVVVVLGAGQAFAEPGGPCLKPTDPVAGILRKVTIREPSTRELITNWHLALSEPLCVKIDDIEWTNQLDIEVVFAKSVNLKEADEALGLPFGVQGTMVGFRDARDTADVIVMDAKPYDDLDDAGEIRKRK